MLRATIVYSCGSRDVKYVDIHFRRAHESVNKHLQIEITITITTAVIIRTSFETNDHSMRATWRENNTRVPNHISYRSLYYGDRAYECRCNVLICSREKQTKHFAITEQ